MKNPTKHDKTRHFEEIAHRHLGVFLGNFILSRSIAAQPVLLALALDAMRLICTVNVTETLSTVIVRDVTQAA
jgi:hypothetical protein